MSEVAAVGIPDTRLGELVGAVVSIKPAYLGQVTEESLISVARKRYTVDWILLILKYIPLSLYFLLKIGCPGLLCQL